MSITSSSLMCLPPGGCCAQMSVLAGLLRIIIILTQTFNHCSSSRHGAAGATLAPTTHSQLQLSDTGCELSDVNSESINVSINVSTSFLRQIDNKMCLRSFLLFASFSYWDILFTIIRSHFKGLRLKNMLKWVQI